MGQAIDKKMLDYRWGLGLSAMEGYMIYEMMVDRIYLLAGQP
jgi:hypothetical protein